MSFVLAAPEALATAASDLAGIGSTLGTASAAVAAPTTGVLAAAADEVSAQVAALLSGHGLGYQQLSARLAAFHEQFVQALSAGASTYAAVEANAAQTLANAVNAPAEAVLGHPLIGSGAGAGAARGIAAAVGGAVSNALRPLESTVLGSNFLGGAGLLGSQAGALLSRPTGGLSAVTAARALLAPAAMTNAAAAPAAFLGGAIGNAIENAYLAIEPWVQYGFNLAAYAVGFLPWIGWLAPQINFFYYLFEPIVQSALFNTIDWLQRTITFSEGLSNFWAATTASINQFINTEINWLLSVLPPLPPLPPAFP
ncbi:MAG: PE family protein [Mycobacterium sp.]|uniref:PE family protein n=1 Tax=Mycobacterium sp. TaxID=1785 RepID=UPI003F9B31DA